MSSRTTGARDAKQMGEDVEEEDEDEHGDVDENAAEEDEDAEDDTDDIAAVLVPLSVI